MPLLEKQLFVQESTIPGAGQGLFTRVAIPKGTRIIEYTGRVSTWENADHQEGLNAYIYYMSDDIVIDASKRKKSLGRYANDARGMKKIKGVLNNCVYVEEGTRVFIESIKPILAGGEILVSYGKEYWDVIKKNYADLEK
jgi:SET domain-containing protein